MVHRLQAPVPAAEPRPWAFTAQDGLKVSGWIFRRHDAPGPLLIDVHGGVIQRCLGAEIDPSRLYRQELADAGWTILLLNARGSDGYGESFARTIAGAWARRTLVTFSKPRTVWPRTASWTRGPPRRHWSQLRWLHGELSDGDKRSTHFSGFPVDRSPTSSPCLEHRTLGGLCASTTSACGRRVIRWTRLPARRSPGFSRRAPPRCSSMGKAIIVHSQSEGRVRDTARTQQFLPRL